MVLVKREGIILEPTRLKFESKGVFNPACIRKGRYVHMFYRAWDKNDHSTIGYCKLDGPLKVVERAKKPVLFPELNYENNLEDPRIVFLDGTYYLTYTAYDNRNVHIKMTLTTLGCPLFETIEQDIKGSLKQIGLDEKNVTIELVFDPPWSIEKMSESARAMIGI